MLKIVIICAGSGFGGRLSVVIMSREALCDATICLVDIHPGRLKKGLLAWFDPDHTSPLPETYAP